MGRCCGWQFGLWHGVCRQHQWHGFYEITLQGGFILISGIDGAYPKAGLILAGNTLYGTTFEGGSSGYGTVFAINTNGTGFSMLHSFAGAPNEGAKPEAGLTLLGTTLFGTTESGGTIGYGTVFSLTLPVALPQLPIIELLSLAGATPSIISTSIPVNSQDPLCRPSYDNVWTVTVPPFPFNTASGIGIIVAPTWTSVNDNSDFALHQNDDIQPSPLFVAPNIPNPATVTVTYVFDQAIVISGVEIVQHLNGITKVEGFLGNSTNTLVSLGSVFGPSYDITDGTFVVPYDGTPQVFNFGNTNVSGTVFQVVIRKTSYPTAFATHRIYPLDASALPTPVASGPEIVSSIRAVIPSCSNLILGISYQLQITTNLTDTFTNYGAAFTASSTTHDLSAIL